MSQSILPCNFSVKGLSVIERRRLEYYYEQYVLRRSWIYGEGHFILACYAALPVVLTPDLLYKLWLNFKDYWWEEKQAVIHPVAPADLLLSPLVEEIGHELYEMPESIRQVLLLHLKEITSESAINPQKLYNLTEIAQFLHSYAQYDFTPTNKNDDAFREAQIWTALSYLDPGQAFGQLVNKYKQAKNKSSDQLRYANAIGNMSRRFMLDIVRDPALVPPAHKAVTALTSIVKDVFNDRDPARLAELQRETQASEDEVLTDAPVVKENVINIEIDELVTARLGGPQKKKGKGKLRALVVGVNREVIDRGTQPQNPDKASAKLFAAILQDQTVNELDYELILLVGSSATKQAILNEWSKMVENATGEDDLLFYLAGTAIDRDGHCHVNCVDITNPAHPGSFLIDQEIGRIANSKQVASITMIIQTDHASTGYWLDTSRDGNIVFAVCQYGQDLYLRLMRSQEYGAVSVFTFALVKALREKRMQITNRGLFILAMEYYHDELISKNNEDRVWDKNLPVLLCNNKSYDLFFTQGRNNQVALQNALRDMGFYTGDVTGIWDAHTEKALVASGLPTGLSKRGYIEMLNEQKKMRSKDDPIFLFIFSDPGEKLKELERERQQIIAAVADDKLAYRVHIQELHNPDSKELMDFFIHPANRNRIQLVYYSGFDEKGNFLLKDGAFSIGGFVGLLEYQQNIQLFVSNTCRSEYFAEFISVLGVPLSIGVRGEISDPEGADFGIELFKTIVEGRQLNDVQNLGRKFLPRDARFILYGKDQEAVLPWRFREDVKMIKVFISYADEDYDLVTKLKDKIRAALPNVEIAKVKNEKELPGPYPEYKDFLIRNDAVLICISPAYISSENCMAELKIVSVNNIPVIGIDLMLDERTNNLSEFSGIKLFARLPGKFYPNHFPVVFSDFTGDYNKDNYTNELYPEFLKELGDAIEKSLDEKKNATVFVAQNEFPSFAGDIIGREDLLQKISLRLSPLAPVLLSGTIGMGKTTVAIAYCNKEEYTSKYNYVIWADGSEGIYNGLRMALYTFLDLRRLFTEHINDLGYVLHQLTFLTDRFLLVIDNVNDPSELQLLENAWSSGNANMDCLIVTRCNFPYSDLKVGPLSLSDASLLYKRFNQKVFQNEAFQEIYDHIGGNLLLLEVLAKFGNSSLPIESTDQLLAWLQSRYEAAIFDDPELVGNMSLNFSIKLGHLVNEEKGVLREFSLFPARDFPINLLSIVLGDDVAERISLLVRYGWLEQIEHAYKMPFIVKELIRGELNPDAENCLRLIKRLNELMDDQNVENRSDLISIGISIIEKIGMSGSNDALMGLGKLQFILGREMRDVERFDEGIRMALRSITLFTITLPSFEEHVEGLQLLGDLYYKKKQLGGSIHAYRECRQLLQEQIKKSSGSLKDELLFQLINIYHKIGSLHGENKEYDAAIISYTDALKLNRTLDKRGLMDDWIIKLGIKCYEGIGKVYQETERDELALVSFEEGLSLLNKWGDFEGAGEIRASLDVKIKQTQDRLNKQKNLRESFLSEAELFSVVERSGKLSAPDKPIKSLLLFQTEKEQTWLIATTQYVFIIIDDKKTRKSGKLIQRQIEKNDVLSIQTKPGVDETSGSVKFADQGIWWFYNLSFFPTDEILLQALGKLVSDEKGEEGTFSGFELEFPKAHYARSDVDNTISLSAGKLQAFIVDRTLVCFATEVTKQQRLDVLELLLLAQLAARREYPEMEQAMDWHRSFINVLTKIGCIIEAGDFSQFVFSGKTFRLENSIMNMMAGAFFKNNLTEFLEKNLAAIKRSNTKKGGYIQAFERNTHSDNNAAFQVCLVANSDGGLELNFGMLALSSDSHIEKLFGVWSTENTEMHYNTLRGTLNEHLYANVRDVINEKLSFSKGMYIVGIKLF